jgi:hypothetical protein
MAAFKGPLVSFEAAAAVPFESRVSAEVATARPAMGYAGASRGSNPIPLSYCPGRHYSSTF